MLAKLKLVGYAGLLILAIWFARGFYVNYSKVMDAAAEESATREPGAAPTTSQPEAKTDTAVVATNPETTNSVAGTNAVAEATQAAVGSTNNATSSTKAGKRAKKAATELVKMTAEQQEAELAHARKSMMGCLGGLVLAAIGLGVMLAYDVTAYMTHRSVDMLFDDDGTAGKDPEYENAEHVYNQGHPMEAIQMMRDYLKKNPREQFVALRIAEIYEKDFRNYLAAALEYEEVLKYKLPSERWGWAAIHLCNLYTKLGRENDHNALLQKIVDSHPNTGAAKKARSRLGIPEEAPQSPEESATPAEAAPNPQSDEPKSNLPPGFRPKK